MIELFIFGMALVMFSMVIVCCYAPYDKLSWFYDVRADTVAFSSCGMGLIAVIVVVLSV